MKWGKHIEKILAEKDKALDAALVSLNSKLALLNELRSGVATKDEVTSLEKRVEDLKERIDKNEGKGAGIQQFIGWIVAAVVILGFIIKYM